MRTAVALLVVVVSVPLVRAADPDPKSLIIPASTANRATELVAQLPDRDFTIRAAATKALRALGRFALPALREALATSTNAEVRLRVELLLPAAASADLRARVDCFLADAAGKFQHDLPGAKAFFAAAGKSDAAKQLFADVMRSANRDLVIAVEGPEADLYQLYLTRRADVGYPVSNGGAVMIGRVSSTVTMPVADLAALLFAEAVLPLAQPAARVTPLMSNYNFQTALRNTLAQGAHKDALDALVTHWVDSRESPADIQVALNYMNRFSLPNGLSAARKLLARKEEKPAPGAANPVPVTGFPKAFACIYVARYGTVDDLPMMEALLESDNLVTNFFAGGPNNRRHAIQIRDVALAMCALRTGQDPTGFGLTSRYAGVGVADTLKYSYYSYYFDADTDEQADQKRVGGLKKYTEWKDKQKKDKK